MCSNHFHNINRANKNELFPQNKIIFGLKVYWKDEKQLDDDEIFSI